MQPVEFRVEFLQDLVAGVASSSAILIRESDPDGTNERYHFRIETSDPEVPLDQAVLC